VSSVGCRSRPETHIGPALGVPQRFTQIGRAHIAVGSRLCFMKTSESATFFKACNLVPTQTNLGSSSPKYRVIPPSSACSLCLSSVAFSVAGGRLPAEPGLPPPEPGLPPPEPGRFPSGPGTRPPEPVAWGLPSCGLIPPEPEFFPPDPGLGKAGEGGRVPPEPGLVPPGLGRTAAESGWVLPGNGKPMLAGTRRGSLGGKGAKGRPA
jgi:hypothetical protein